MGVFLTGLRQVRLTQALAHGHAVLLWVEIVAVAGTAPVYEAHTLPLTHVEVPAGHGGTAGASFSLQGAHRCQGDSLLDHPATSNRNYKHSEKKKKNYQQTLPITATSAYIITQNNKYTEETPFCTLWARFSSILATRKTQDDLSSLFSEKAEQYITVSAVSWRKGYLLMHTLI